MRGELKPDDPGIAELDYALGQAQMGLGRMEEARTTFQAVIDARRGGELAAQAQLMRGETYFHEDRLREALREFLQVDILYDAPRWQAAALLEAGKVYERLDQWADAAETYDRLVARVPDRTRTPPTARTRGESAPRQAVGGHERSQASRPGLLGNPSRARRTGKKSRTESRSRWDSRFRQAVDRAFVVSRNPEVGRPFGAGSSPPSSRQSSSSDIRFPGRTLS